MEIAGIAWGISSGSLLVDWFCLLQQDTRSKGVKELPVHRHFHYITDPGKANPFYIAHNFLRSLETAILF
jgi:hypothetical protein